MKKVGFFPKILLLFLAGFSVGSIYSMQMSIEQLMAIAEQESEIGDKIRCFISNDFVIINLQV